MIQTPTQWDKFFAFMLGIDEPVEKLILEYIYRKGKDAPLSEIKNYIIHENHYAVEGRLTNRLSSLTKTGFLTKYEEHGRIWYKINEGKVDEQKAETIHKYHKDANTY